MDSPEFNKRYSVFKEAVLASLAKGNPQYIPTVPQANELVNSAGIAV